MICTSTDRRRKIEERRRNQDRLERFAKAWYRHTGTMPVGYRSKRFSAYATPKQMVTQ